MQVAWVKIESKRFAIANRLQCFLSRNNIKCDLCWVYFQCKFHAAFVKYVQDRIPHFGEILETVLNHLIANWRKTVQHMPDTRTGKTVDNFHSHIFSRSCGCFHRFYCPSTFFFGIPGTIRRGEHIRTTVIVQIAYQLPG